MQKKQFLYAAATAIVMMTGTSQASAREFGDIYTQCGLGALIFPKNEVLAAITNVTWDLGTTAITSDLSTPDSCQGGKPKKAAFIHDSYAQIESDLARGTGKHLAALMTMSGCQASAQPEIARAVRADFAQSVAAADYSVQTRYQQAESLYTQFHQRLERDFAQVCSAI